jgi:hypothetical protein
MTTTTQAGSITLPAGELRAILAALDEYTSPDKHRPALQLAQVRPILVEQRIQSAGVPVIEWQATNSTELVSITHTCHHELTDAVRIDPAAILATLPKKAAGETVLTLTADTWQLTNANTTSGGPHEQHPWPNTFGLWKDQRAGLAPHSIGAPMLARLAKLAKHLGSDQVNAETMAHTNDQPDPRRPLVYTITGGTIEARVLIMPRRRN